MILTCEKCETRYLVPASAIGADGRRVRCKKCGYEWRQVAEKVTFGAHMDDALAAQDDAGFGDNGHDYHRDRDYDRDGRPFNRPAEDDIVFDPAPARVAPLPEGADLPTLLEDYPDFKTDSFVPGVSTRAGRGAGYGAALAVFIVTLGLLAAFRAPVLAAWPAAAGLYERVGIMPSWPGEGLILDRVKATVRAQSDGTSVLVVNGHVVNLKSGRAAVPRIQFSLLKADGTVFDSWVAEPPQDDIDSYADSEFEAAYPAIQSDIKELRVRFLLPGDNGAGAAL